MKVFLFGFTMTGQSLYVTNDNKSHTYDSITYNPSALDCKDFTFDLKEVVGEVNVTLPWTQSGFLQELAQRTLEGPVAVTVDVFETSDSSAVETFSGFVNSFKVTKALVELQCISFLEFARDNFPRICATRHCNHRLYSNLCTVNAASYTLEGTITSINFERTAVAVSLAGTTISAYYTYGYIKGSDNIQRYIVGDSGSSVRTFDLLHPAPEAWTTGMTIFATAGCDKSSTTCDTKFGNFVNFLGFPYAPFESIRFTGLRGDSVSTSKK